MATANKTQPTPVAVTQFLESVSDPVRRSDAMTLCAMFERLSGEPPVMWGPSIIGFGRYHYGYDSGREGDMCRIGFSPRKANLSLYLMGCYCDGGFSGRSALMAGLGKYKTGASCLYLSRLAEVDLAVLEQLCVESLTEMARRYPE